MRYREVGERRMTIKVRKRMAAAVIIGTWLFASAALAQQVELLWLGHSAFRITSTTGKVIVIDPFLTTNPRTPAKYKDLAALGKVDLILVTHGHRDHVHDLPELAKLTGATVVASYELALTMGSAGLLDATKTIAMNKGGTVSPLGPAIKIHMVPAQHSSSLDMKDLKPDWTGTTFLTVGTSVGYVIEFENGFRIYHSGDTDVFGDMALIGRRFKPDLALVCIGGHYTMDPEQAAFALREYIRPKQVIPIHYGTFPVINHTPAELKTALGKSPIKVLDVKPGDVVRF
jgi:L-ascorbate metabolism protein UlaG (beta-lactamase superfamily)